MAASESLDAPASAWSTGCGIMLARLQAQAFQGGAVSTYQCYEFHAIDRLLTDEEQQAVARLSSRVDPHPRQAVFVYHWSGFPGNAREVLTRYYDAMFYTASWGSRQLMFRFPRTALDLESASAYCQPLIVEDYVSFSTAGEHVVLDIGFDDEEGHVWVEVEGGLAAMLSLRDDILRGDYRALYLAWLKVLEVDDLLETIPEPPVPPGLRTLSPALRAFVEFLEIDEMVIQVAAEASGDLHRAARRLAGQRALPASGRGTRCLSATPGPRRAAPHGGAEPAPARALALARDSAATTPHGGLAPAGSRGAARARAATPGRRG